MTAATAGRTFTLSGLKPYSPLKGDWIRTLKAKFASSPLATSHTVTVGSRFSDGALARSRYPILYLAENVQVARLEVGALLGLPLVPGGLVVHPASKTWTDITVQVDLQYTVDLSDPAVQGTIGISAQELTGDWRGYDWRATAGGSVIAPVNPPPAPTQELGAALYRLADLEGFLTLSTKAPYRKILVVFPDKLDSASTVQWYDDHSGTWIDIT